MLGFLKRWFETTPDVGEGLAGSACWTVVPCRDPEKVLRALHMLFGDDCFMTFEGTTERDFAEELALRAVSQPFKVDRGTIWPKSDFYHVPLSHAADIADIVERDVVVFPSFHFFVHDGQRVLLQWYDAFTDDPMHIAETIARPHVELFADTIGVAPPELGPMP